MLCYISSLLIAITWSILLNVSYATAAVSPSDVMQQLSNEYVEQTLSSLQTTQCTATNIVVREEWENLSKRQRLQYIKAVQCLHAKPSLRNKATSRSRAEDFVIAHLEQTLYIHYSALLLPWHRYFLHLYETALREECGYQGYQPYWDWSRYLEHPTSSSIFDGSEYSLGGNGEAITHGTQNLTLPGGAPPGGFQIRPPGTGGGCVYQGPFKDLTLRVSARNNGASTPPEVFDAPRCLKRDFYLPLLANANSYQNVTQLVLQSSNIKEFHTSVESNDGIHPNGHLYIGGENLNLFTSPGDPSFFFHHAMVDRVWAIWQSRDPESRTYALDGTLTFMNYPPSRNATLLDILNVGNLAEARNIGDLMSTKAGPLCYVYK